MLYDPHRRWAPRGICREEDSALFFSAGGQPNRKPARVTQARWDQAKEICAMCPVLKECARDTLGEEYGVYGGLDEHQRYLIRRRLYKAIPGWPQERRLAWAREIWDLRRAGLTWSQILARTGIPAGAGERLLKIWTDRLAALPPSGEVVDLKLPEAEEQDEVRLPPFPDRPGRRDCWVRHRRAVSDGWYRGETPDGAWVYVTTNAGRGQVHKWIAAADVQLYRPVQAIVLHYAARPDLPAEDLDATA